MRWLFDIAWLALLVFIAATAELLPAELGEPARRLTRESYLVLTLGMAVLVPWLCTRGVGLFGRRWPQRINLPHKRYWMDLPRREASLAWLQQHGFILGLFIVATLAGSHYLELQRSRPELPAPGEAGIVAALALFTAGLIFWTRAVFRRFPAPPREAEPPRALTPRRPERPRR